VTGCFIAPNTDGAARFAQNTGTILKIKLTGSLPAHPKIEAKRTTK